MKKVSRGLCQAVRHTWKYMRAMLLISSSVQRELHWEDRGTAGWPAIRSAAGMGLRKAEAIGAACLDQAGPPLWVQVVS